MTRILAEWRVELVTFIISPIILYLIYRTGRFLKSIVQFAFEWLLWLLARHTLKSLSSRLSMRFYCRNQLSAENTRILRVPGHRTLTLPVDKVFVPLTIEYSEQPSDSANNLELLEGSNRLLVVGDPGSGKSSLVKYLFRQSCRTAERLPTKSRLPIQVELKKLGSTNVVDEDEAAEWLLSELRKRVSVVEGYNMGQLFDSCLTTVGVLLLLDGLDEVSGDDYPAISAALRGLSRLLAAKSDGNTIVITMRIQYFQQVQHQLVGDYAQVAYLRPFKPNEIYTFLTRWPFKSHPGRNITRIWADLTDRPTLRTMCSNPLVLAMYVANDQTLAPGEIPESRTDFYRSVVDELLVMRRRRQEIVRGPSRALREQREEILGELAYKNLIDAGQSANSLAWADALGGAARVWNVKKTEAEDRFRTLANETGIIAEERYAETFQFIHLTFCEFLAAVECASTRNRWESLLDTHKRFTLSQDGSLTSRLIEVIPFALALMARPERSRCLSEVAALGDREILGRCFLETQLFDHSEWPKYIAAESEYLTTEEAPRHDQDWLRRLHLFSVVLRDARAWMLQVAGKHVGPVLDGLLPGIVGSNRETLEEIFSLYASQDAPAAFRLAESVGVNMLSEHCGTLIDNCQEPPFLALAMERAPDDSVNHESWLLLLAESGLRYQNVAHTLSQATIPEGLRGTAASISAPPLSLVVRSQSYYQVCLAFALSQPTSSFRREFKITSTLSRLPMLNNAAVTILALTEILFLLGGLAVFITSLFLSNGRLAIVAAVLYLFGNLLICATSYYSSLQRRLCNYDRVTGDPDERKVQAPGSFERVLVRLGRLLTSAFLRSQQLALYQIGLIRGVEFSRAGEKGKQALEFDLLPPRRLRAWAGAIGTSTSDQVSSGEQDSIKPMRLN